MTLSTVMDLVITVGLLVAIIFLIILVARMRKLLFALAGFADGLAQEMGKLLLDVSALVEDANEDVAKLENLLDSASAVTNSLGTASRYAFTAFASPIVRARALKAGVTRISAVFHDSSFRKG